MSVSQCVMSVHLVKHDKQFNIGFFSVIVGILVSGRQTLHYDIDHLHWALHSYNVIFLILERKKKEAWSVLQMELKIVFLLRSSCQLGQVS